MKTVMWDEMMVCHGGVDGLMMVWDNDAWYRG